MNLLHAIIIFELLFAKTTTKFRVVTRFRKFDALTMRQIFDQYDFQSHRRVELLTFIDLNRQQRRRSIFDHYSQRRLHANKSQNH